MLPTGAAVGDTLAGAWGRFKNQAAAAITRASAAKVRPSAQRKEDFLCSSTGKGRCCAGAGLTGVEPVRTDTGCGKRDGMAVRSIRGGRGGRGVGWP